MKRREFTGILGAGVIAGALGASSSSAQEPTVTKAAKIPSNQKAGPFSLLFAPNASHFGGGKKEERYFAALEAAHVAGFRAWEDNWLMSRPAAFQEKLGARLEELGMTMGVSVVTTGGGGFWFESDAEMEQRVIDDCNKAVAMAKRVGHKWFTTLPGTRDPERPLAQQFEGSMDLMNKACDIFEKEGLVFVLEPLSHDLNKRPVLLETFREGFDFCKMVNRPSCKLLADYYHQQQVAGNLMKFTDECWDEIAYVQFGDVPGRKQPGTGEINHLNLVKHLVSKGYEGVIGLEHGIKGTSDDLVKAYRELDAVVMP